MVSIARVCSVAGAFAQALTMSAKVVLPARPWRSSLRRLDRAVDADGAADADGSDDGGTVDTDAGDDEDSAEA